MKNYFIAASLIVLAGCATTEDRADIDTTPQPVAVETSSIEAGSQADLEANANHRVYFAYDEYTLSPQAQSTLRQQADWLKANPEVQVQLAGHADERGTREYNLALGSRRAGSAKSFLVGLGVEASRIDTVSHGKERPVALGTGESVWAQNRNSTTTVMAAR
ncbi:MAG: peptidoglycan-associated lipoprotein Pal [Pseudomonadota bacterium]